MKRPFLWRWLDWEHSFRLDRTFGGRLHLEHIKFAFYVLVPIAMTIAVMQPKFVRKLILHHKYIVYPPSSAVPMRLSPTYGDDDTDTTQGTVTSHRSTSRNGAVPDNDDDDDDDDDIEDTTNPRLTLYPPPRAR